MRPPKQARISQIIVAILMLLMLGQSQLTAAASRTRLQKQLAANQAKKSKLRGKIISIRNKAQGTKRRLHAANTKVTASRSSALYWRTRFERAAIELHNASVALQKSKREFEGTRTDAKNRLVSLYQRGEPGYMELMLASNDFGEMLQRSELANFMMERDRDVLAQLKERKEKLDRYQAQVEDKKQEVATYRQRAEITVARDLRVRNATDTQLQTQRRQMDALAAEMAAIERDSREVTSMLRALQNTSKGRKRMNGQQHAIGGLPVAGHITSPFGYRTHPILKTRRLHTGVDIGAPSGTPIHAAGAGEVIYASWRGGYGNCVIIDHGGGKATLYAHMSGYNTSMGRTVGKGDIIGYVGSTGLSTGPHLHYEVRINGTPVNPL